MVLSVLSNHTSIPSSSQVSVARVPLEAVVGSHCSTNTPVVAVSLLVSAWGRILAVVLALLWVASALVELSSEGAVRPAVPLNNTSSRQLSVLLLLAVFAVGLAVHFPFEEAFWLVAVDLSSNRSHHNLVLISLVVEGSVLVCLWALVLPLVVFFLVEAVRFRKAPLLPRNNNRSMDLVLASLFVRSRIL